MLLHQRLRLDILPEVSKFLGARTGDTQTDKGLKRWGTEHSQGLQCCSLLLPCIAQSVFPENTTLQLCPRVTSHTSHPPEVVALCRVCSHHPLFPSHTWSSSRMSPSSESWSLSLPTARDVLAHSGCSGPHSWEGEDQPRSLDKLHHDDFYQ